jgi:hypothetical protein
MRKIAAEKPRALEQNAGVAPARHSENKRVLPCHEATKFTPPCLVVVDHDDNGELR